MHPIIFTTFTCHMGLKSGRVVLCVSKAAQSFPLKAPDFRCNCLGWIFYFIWRGGQNGSALFF